MNAKIGHLAFYVTDMKASMDFYAKAFGCTHAFSLKNEKGEDWIEYIKLPSGQFLELFYLPEGMTDVVKDGMAYKHLCIEVDDCAEAAAHFTAAGIEIWRPLKQASDGNWQVWIRDPDLNQIEVMQISPDSPQAKA